MKKLLQNNLFLSLLSGILLLLSWTEYSIGWIMLFAFVPLLQILHNQLKSNSPLAGTNLFLYSLLSFFIWNTYSTWWIMYASVPGCLATILIPSFLMAFVMFMVFLTFKQSGKRIGYLSLVTFWIAYEYLLMHSQLSWPWSILGYVFENNTSLIQWYEYTGTFGGSVWILCINLLIFEIIQIFKASSSKAKKRGYIIGLALILIIPMGYSIIRFNTYKEEINPVKVVIIQPNIDPYNEKFNIPVYEQIHIITETAKKDSTFSPDYFIAPETAIANGFYESKASNEPSIKHIVDFLKAYPNSQFIIGATTRIKYSKPEDFTETCHIDDGDSTAYDIFNSAMQISPSSDILFYHKSKLLPGVETMPFPRINRFFAGMITDLGGINGTHGIQENREIFANNNDDIKPGVPICYESVYGEFVGEFVTAGANILFVITNDGWWRNTAGHKRHMSYAKIRAIETRRSIARSANTGISCIINQKGEVISSLDWWKRGTIKGTINANDEITFYVKYGDYLARMSMLVAIILIVVLLLGKTMSKLKKE